MYIMYAYASLDHDLIIIHYHNMLSIIMQLLLVSLAHLTYPLEKLKASHLFMADVFVLY